MITIKIAISIEIEARAPKEKSDPQIAQLKRVNCHGISCSIAVFPCKMGHHRINERRFLENTRVYNNINRIS